MPLDPQQMIERSCQLTGLDDWGGDDFLVPFNTLVESLNSDAQLSELGAQRVDTYLVQRLAQRLQLHEDRKQFPEICAQRIERPIFVTGLPRAGTSLMHALLGSDPEALAPRLWQWLSPSPPPNSPGADHRGTVARMTEFLTDQGWFTPEMLTIHDFTIETPEECFWGFELSFVSAGFTGFWHVPGYFPVLARGFAPAYAIHHKILQAMQYGTSGRRWVLKAPEHATHLAELLQQYPDAVIVQHHRDPAKVMASNLSTVSAMRKMYSDTWKLDREQAQFFVQMFAVGLKQMAEIRSSTGLSGRVIDVHYSKLEEDPMREVELLYQQAALTLTPEARNAIEATIALRRKGRHGVHTYSLEDYGLTADEVRAEFDDYMQTFDVKMERV